MININMEKLFFVCSFITFWHFNCWWKRKEFTLKYILNEKGSFTLIMTQSVPIITFSSFVAFGDLSSPFSTVVEENPCSPVILFLFLGILNLYLSLSETIEKCNSCKMLFLQQYTYNWWQGCIYERKKTTSVEILICYYYTAK